MMLPRLLGTHRVFRPTILRDRDHVRRAAGMDLPIRRAYRGAVASPATCVLCGDEIDVGEAWMRADEDGAEIRAHTGCVYRDEPDPSRSARWEPTEGSSEAG
jgi:hypothetical protein